MSKHVMNLDQIYIMIKLEANSQNINKIYLMFRASLTRSSECMRDLNPSKSVRFMYTIKRLRRDSIIYINNIKDAA